MCELHFWVDSEPAMVHPAHQLVHPSVWPRCFKTSEKLDHSRKVLYVTHPLISGWSVSVHEFWHGLERHWAGMLCTFTLCYKVLVALMLPKQISIFRSLAGALATFALWSESYWSSWSDPESPSRRSCAEVEHVLKICSPSICQSRI